MLIYLFVCTSEHILLPVILYNKDVSGAIPPFAAERRRDYKCTHVIY